MEILVNFSAAFGVASAIILFIYLVSLKQRRDDRTETEITDEELRLQIRFWTEGIKRLNNAAKVDRAFGGENLHATKNELAELTKTYKITKN